MKYIHERTNHESTLKASLKLYEIQIQRRIYQYQG